MSSFCETSEPFVLQVTSDDFSPEIPRGSIIVVDPARTVQSHDYVVAKVSDKIELGRITQIGRKWQLAASDRSDRSCFELTLTDVVGRVVQCLDSNRNLIRDFG